MKHLVTIPHFDTHLPINYIYTFSTSKDICPDEYGLLIEFIEARVGFDSLESFTNLAVL